MPCMACRPEEAYRRYRESNCTPGNIVRYPDQLECWLLLNNPATSFPEEVQFLRFCSYCGGDTRGVIYLCVPEHDVVSVLP